MRREAIPEPAPLPHVMPMYTAVALSPPRSGATLPKDAGRATASPSVVPALRPAVILLQATAPVFPVQPVTIQALPLRQHPPRPMPLASLTSSMWVTLPTSPNTPPAPDILPVLQPAATPIPTALLPLSPRYGARRAVDVPPATAPIRSRQPARRQAL